MNRAPDWAGSSGDIWADNWRRTDRGLAGVAAVLDPAILAAAPIGPFRALDIGTGPGTTALALAAGRPDAEILACDVSAPLIEVARRRAAGATNIRFVIGDAALVAVECGPFDLIFSRHGVMFFDDPKSAFRSFRESARGGGRLVFSCFQSWLDNPWASALAEAAAGAPMPMPDRSPGGFAFADPDYVLELLTIAGWTDARPRPLPFTYVAGEGDNPEEEAMALLAKVGPAARVLDALAVGERPTAMERMRRVVADHIRDSRVEFPAAAWIWSAKAE